MKLFVLATLVAAAAAARLEHLERGYLPPASQGANSASPQSGSEQNFGSSAGQTSYGSGQSFSSSGSGEFGSSQVSAATSNQYLPPDHGPSSGSNSFGNPPVQTFRPSNNGNGGSPGAQSQTPSREYLGPQSANIQSSTLQPFDEETGYHYKK